MSSPGEISRIREENFGRALNAVDRDDIDELKNALDVLPEFNTMVAHYDWNLLQLSCRFKKKKVFDYLLNLNCFDLEVVDSDGYSALVKAMNHDCDYFSVKLINAGTDVFKICGPEERTYLHFAMYYYLLETAELLLQKGVDPNAQDYERLTSLHILLCYYSREVDEGVDLLLQYGADTAIYDKERYLPFDYAVIFRMKLHIQEHLFYCTFDSHSADYEISSIVLKKLLDAPDYDNVSPLLDNVMDVVSDVILEEWNEVNFFIMPPNLLKKFIERYGYIIRRQFSIIKPIGDMKMNINNIEKLLNSELHFDTVELISRLKLWKIYLHNHRISREERSSLILYLLSYGLNVTSYDCQKMYYNQGYSDLFKTMLLHLNDADTSHIDLSMRIIVDIHFDLNTFLASFHPFASLYQIELLLDHFANSELRLLCERTGDLDLINKVRQLPTVPSLLQLARDETKRHIVRRYNLQKTSQYYWVLRRLKIGTTYAEILSFETILYG